MPEMSEWPKVYDPSNDLMRAATQDDIDKYEDILKAYGSLLYLMRGITAKMEYPANHHNRTAMLSALVQRMDELKCRPQPQS
jgi:hypothetical protein